MIEMGAVLGCLYLSSKIDLSDPEMLNYARIFFGATQVVIFGAMYVMYTKIQKLKTSSKETVVVKTKTEEQTLGVGDYDKTEFDKLFNQQLMSLGIIMVIHLYFGAERPLLLQGVMAPIRVLKNPLSKIHVLGWEVTRPFAQAGGMLEKMAEDWAQNADKKEDAAIENKDEDKKKDQ